MKISLVTKEEKILVVANNYILKKGEKEELGSVLNIVFDNTDVEIKKEDKDRNNRYIIDEIVKPGDVLVIKVNEEEPVRLR